MQTEMMSEKDIKEILTRNSIGRLGCAHANQPYVLPISFVYDLGHLYGFSTVGQKIEWMRANPKVCVEIDEISDRLHWASVVIIGRYHEILDSPEHVEEHNHARQILASRSLWWEPGFAFRRLKTKDRLVTVYYTIKIDSMTGYRTVAGHAS